MPRLIWGEYAILDVAKYLRYNATNEDLAKFINTYIGSAEVKGDELYYSISDSGKPCPFLTKDKKCSIYPVRPEGCVLFPTGTDFGVAGIDCQAMERIMMIIHKLGRGIPHFTSGGTETLEKLEEQRDGQFGYFHSEKPNDKQWKRALEKYLQTRPSREELRLFLKLNFR